MALSNTPTVDLAGIAKHFGGVHALNDVSLTIAPGEVHGLLGENGSGKSTLIKILAGFHVPDEGEMRVGGNDVTWPMEPGAYRDLGFEFVHQDLGLVPSLSVTENLRIGSLAAGKQFRRISWRGEVASARRLFEGYGVRLDPTARIGDLRKVEQALVAIIRAVEGVRARLGEGGQGGAGLLVLDEPTVFLPRTGTEQLFELVRSIAAGGASVLFVSHHLDEALEITDRITVLRDGRLVGNTATSATTKNALVRMIVGRDIADARSKVKPLAARPTVAAASGVSGGLLEDVSLELDEGEILGLTGLVGSGFEDIPYLLFGAWAADRGRLVIGDDSCDLSHVSPARALKLGLALVPADRQSDASLPSLSVTDNMTVMMLSQFYNGGVLRRRAMRREVAKLMSAFDVRPADPSAAYASLSGGNQQKALLAKWLDSKPRILLLHEPTQGVDVGAREQVYDIIRPAAEAGMAVIWASSDYEELAAVCHRVLIFARGRVIAELRGDDVLEDRIKQRCYDSMPEMSRVLSVAN